MENLEIGTLKQLPISQTDNLSDNRRRRPLRSRTADKLLHILSLCYADSSRIIHNSDKDTENDVPSDRNDMFQEQVPMDETQLLFDAQQGALQNKNMESAEHDHNLLGEKKDLPHKVNTNPSVNFDIKSQENYDTISSSPHLPTDKDVEELEILEDLMEFMPGVDTSSVGKTDSKSKGFTCTKPGPDNDNNSILLFTESVENGGKDIVGVVNKTKRNLVDYSEIGFDSQHVVPLQSNSKINATKNQDHAYPLKENRAQNNKKRPGSCTKEERTNKKSKKYVDSTTCPANLPSLGEQHVDASQEVDASANNDAAIKKKKKRALTKERKAKKKIKDRIKRAEHDRKLGIKRLKLQPVIKEKKISYCRHYMNGRCHEGEKCKFSHDTTPLTKSKPCCHFARHACMKGGNCPYDHDLSKYPCNNYQTKGSCNRGSDCMFSHEFQAQPSESPLDASNELKPEPKPPSNSGSKLAETNSCSVPKFVDITPKSARPPKGINFLSQEKLPLASHDVRKITKTPAVIQDYKEITETPSETHTNEITKTTPVVQDFKEITKAPPAIPHGINFLSFGRKPGVDYSNGGFSLKIDKRIEKSQLSDVEGLKSNSIVNMSNEVKVDFPTDGPGPLKKPMPALSFIPSTTRKALHSTLVFASKFESGVKSKV